MDFDVEHISSSLTGMSWTIEQLLNSRTIIADRLEKHLLNLANEIHTLPRTEAQLARKWNDRLAVFMSKYQDVTVKQATEESLNNGTLQLPTALALVLDQLAPTGAQEKLDVLRSTIDLLFGMSTTPTLIIVRKLAEIATLRRQVPAGGRAQWDAQVGAIQQAYQHALYEATRISATLPAVAIQETTLLKIAKSIDDSLAVSSPPRDLLLLWISDLTRIVAQLEPDSSLKRKWFKRVAELMFRISNCAKDDEDSATDSSVPPKSPTPNNEDVDWLAMPNSPGSSYKGLPVPNNPPSPYWDARPDSSTSLGSSGKSAHVSAASPLSSVDWTAEPSNPGDSYKGLPMPTRPQSAYWDALPSRSESNSCASSRDASLERSTASLTVTDDHSTLSAVEKTVIKVDGSASSKSTDWTAKPKNPGSSYRNLAIPTRPPSAYWDARPDSLSSSDISGMDTNASGDYSSDGSKSVDWTAQPKNPGSSFRNLAIPTRPPSAYWDARPDSLSSSDISGKDANASGDGGSSDGSKSVDWTAEPTNPDSSYKGHPVPNRPQSEYWDARPSRSSSRSSSRDAEQVDAISTTLKRKGNWPKGISSSSSSSSDASGDANSPLSAPLLTSSMFQPASDSVSSPLLPTGGQPLQFEFGKYLITKAFTQFTPIPADALPQPAARSLCSLICLVHLTKRILERIDPDGKLLTRDVVKWSLEKLAPSMELTPRPRILISLIFHLTSILSDLKNRLVTQSDPQSAFFCTVCKTSGHLPADCPKVEFFLCFKCYEAGHNNWKCTEAELEDRDLLRTLIAKFLPGQS